MAESVVLPLIDNLPHFQHLVEALSARVGGSGTQPMLGGLGLIRAARLPVTAALAGRWERPLLLVTDRQDRALNLADELGFWLPSTPIMVYPEPTPLFYEPAAWGALTRRERINVLTNLAEWHLPGARPAQAPVIVTTVRALMTRTIPRRDFLSAVLRLKLNQVIAPDHLRLRLSRLGYERADTVTESGQFALRGGIIDFWAPAEPLPIRLEFFGDEIDTLRQFDPVTQRKTQDRTSVLLTPAREALFPEGFTPREGLIGMEEFFIPELYGLPASLLNFLPENSLVLLDDAAQNSSQANEVEEQAVRMREESLREGNLPEGFALPYQPWSDLVEELAGFPALDFGREVGTDPSPLADLFQPGVRYSGRLKIFLSDLQELSAKGGVNVVISRQIARIQELWQEAEVEEEAAQPSFAEGTLSDGFQLKLNGAGVLTVIADSELFGWERPQPRARVRTGNRTPETDFTDLQVGDYVVHVDHGIGRYAGLVRRTMEGQAREYLAVEYGSGDLVYVPTYQADRLSRYVGPSGEAPLLTRLGGGEWVQVKQKVREAVIEVAQDLLDLYARRQAAPGHAFSPDSVWQQDLEAGFPYIETVDQATAIAEVKADMERARPMDRLLCGDVGYGKTEVALRASFKAVMDGKQVAMLVPTTVLAQQHYETFRKRLAPFPVTVQMLSRFRTAKEQDEIVEQIKEGAVDIVIGTHRLLQQDVRFKDLGLVVVDEEQRFGVTHKEYLKKLRTEVDVLTLTATPIPRTLYMALTGVRDISQINTPPAERLPIVTHIGPYSPKVVRQAVLRELERGGQVFFVHNRVQTIAGMERHLSTLVPEARVGIAHGQMDEKSLSQVMTRFTRGDIDVLLSTSIIESGLDIPNANTLIVDRGDTFGLAQLYQLRGRVGRGAQRAYAYFFRHRKRLPTLEGQERLEVIAENNQLGAGYSIAMRDLEMRGAGELLGSRQHGMIAAVGFHLYTRLLGQAVQQLKPISGVGDELPDLPGGMLNLVSVDLPLAVGIPATYIADQSLRLKLYRRLAGLVEESELEALVEEFHDRFGPFPGEVEDLFYQIRVKIRAGIAGLTAVSWEDGQIVLRYPPLVPGQPARQFPPVQGRARSGRNAWWLPGGEGWKDNLLAVLASLSDV